MATKKVKWFTKDGTLLHPETEWSMVAGTPTSLPPSGNAGGDLAGTYPNPTIGEGKVTKSKLESSLQSAIDNANSAVQPSGLDNYATLDTVQYFTKRKYFTSAGEDVSTAIDNGGIEVKNGLQNVNRYTRYSVATITHGIPEGEFWTLMLPEQTGTLATIKDIEEKISASITGNFAQLDNKEAQTFTGLNNFTQPIFFSIANANSAAHSGGTISIYQTDATGSYSNTNTIYVDKIVIADQKAKVSATFGNGYIKRNGYTYKFPQKDGDGTIALKEDIPSGVSALDIFRVGYVYISYVSTSPASMFGGSWTAITGRFLYCNAGTSTGGSNTHTNTVAEMATHQHQYLIHSINNGGDSNGPNGPGSVLAGSTMWGTYYVDSGTGECGDGQPYDIRPAYQTVYAWRRTA